MDKDFIRLGLRSELHKIEEAHGYDAITVPKRKTIACTFTPTKRKGDVRIPFEDLVEIMEFALDNTILRDFEGQLWRQAKGIPMGDPHSPGMTIGTCAWMEHEWLQTVHAKSRDTFHFKITFHHLAIQCLWCYSVQAKQRGYRAIGEIN